MNRDWSDFKALNGNIEGTRTAFEKACERIYRKKYEGERVDAVRVKNGDGGIDVFIGEIGVEPITVIQCKFFLEKFGESQKGQIRESFKTAIESNKYKLKEWILCLPWQFDMKENRWWSKWKDKQIEKHDKDKSFIKLISGNALIDLSKELGLYNDIFKIEDSKKIAETRKIVGELAKNNNDIRRTPQLLGSQISKLPNTNNKLIGREEELQILDDAWNDDSKNIITLKAFGGSGKTALVKTWLYQLAEKSLQDSDVIYVHSFYLQNSVENGQASAEQFFDEALEWFHYEGDPLTSYYNKALKLAILIKQQRTLLVLDGLEPLQHRVKGVNDGEIRDLALSTLIKELSFQNKGLLVILSRQDVTELNGIPDSLVTQYALKPLSIPAGLELFKENKIKGSDKELETAVREFDGHALSLNLLAKYLREYEDSDIRQRTNLRALTDYPEETRETRHAFKVMAAYEQQLEGTSELKILYMMGLFDRPASLDAIRSLRDSGINVLSDTAGSIVTNNKVFKAAARRLREQNLLNIVNSNLLEVYDSHPLVREYFATRLKQKYSEEWHQAHSNLYEYYKESSSDTDTLSEMEPLFAAVMHGCAAGKYQEAFVYIYLERIKRGNTDYLSEKLGAIGADLMVLSYFFLELWTVPVEELIELKPSLLNLVSTRLFALGRIKEAADPSLMALDINIKEKKWGNVTGEAINYSNLQLAAGYISSAIGTSERARVCASKINKKTDKELYESQKGITLANLAFAQLQSGNDKEARINFTEAERLQRLLTPDFKFLYSSQGFNYCDYLLGKGEWKNVLLRTQETIGWVGILGKLQYIALDQLSLGRASLQQAVVLLSKANPQFVIETDRDVTLYLSQEKLLFDEASMQQLLIAEKMLNRSVEGLRNAETIIYLPLALLARASCYRWFLTLPFMDQVKGNAAFHDIDEAYEIANRGDMRLFKIDFGLESARLILTIDAYVQDNENNEEIIDKKKSGREKAITNIKQVKKMIKETGYKRRISELKYLEEWVE